MNSDDEQPWGAWLPRERQEGPGQGWPERRPDPPRVAVPRRESVPVGQPQGRARRRKRDRVAGVAAGAVAMLALSSVGALTIEWVRDGRDAPTTEAGEGGVTMPSTVADVTDLTAGVTSTTAAPAASMRLPLVTFQADGGRALVTGVVPSLDVHNRISSSLAGIYGQENVVTTGVVVDASTASAQWMASVDELTVALGGFDDYRIRFDGDTLTGFVGGGAEFASSSADVPAGYEPILTFVADVMGRDATLTLVVTGHTDSSGPEDANVILSQARAQAVVDRLVQGGIDPGRLEAVGKGPFNPTAPNDTAEGRARNRRVELTLAVGAAPPADS